MHLFHPNGVEQYSHRSIILLSNYPGKAIPAGKVKSKKEKEKKTATNPQ